jgi:predicted transposase/invertase (TIGR01784 family)
MSENQNAGDGEGRKEGEFPPSNPAAFPHDAFFKKAFGDPEHAVGFFCGHLPPAVVRAADWASLTHVSGSFVKPDFRQLHSALLFSVNVGRDEMLLYLLFEHQSEPDETMPLRLLSYILEILNAHQSRHGYPLPPVLPFVLNQGPDSWEHPLCFEDLFAIPEEACDDLLRFVPRFQYALLDLSRHDPASSGDDGGISAIVLDLMKAARIGSQTEFLRRLAGLRSGKILRMLLEKGLFGDMVVYILNVSKDLDPEAICSILSSNPELEHVAMTVAEKLIEKGLEKGLEKGRWIGQIRLLEKFLSLPSSLEDELEALDTRQLEARFKKLDAEYQRNFKNR